VDYFVNAVQGNGVMDGTAVQFPYGDPPFLRKPPEDGIGHPQGYTGNMGQIPLPQGEGLFGGIVNVFQDEVFGVYGIFGHETFTARSDDPEQIFRK
jgi:hypothetical protein